jgi:hypothetical protein
VCDRDPVTIVRSRIEHALRLRFGYRQELEEALGYGHVAL